MSKEELREARSLRRAGQPVAVQTQKKGPTGAPAYDTLATGYILPSVISASLTRASVKLELLGYVSMTVR